MTTFLLLILSLKIATFTPLEEEWLMISKIDQFIRNDLTKAFLDRDSTLITLAAVFIGIYFTAFTLLATISVKSAFSILKKEQFESLLIYTRNAFLVSFSYIFASLLTPLISNNAWIYTSICFLLLTYMLLSALRFGLLIYLILDRDINAYFNKVTADELEEKRKNRILNDLENFLNEQSIRKGKNKADEISKMLERRKMEKEKKQN